MATDQILRPAKELAAGNGAHFPNESDKYRQARNALLAEEIELRRHLERVAEMRRQLPPGGAVTKDYRFEGENGPVRFADLFGDKQTLVVYSYMFGPQRKRPCPMCTTLMSSWDGEAPDIEQRVAFAMTARSPIERLIAFKRERGWNNLKLYSDIAGDYTRDYVSARGRRRPGIQRVHAQGRHDPPFLGRRDGRHDRRSRPGPARRARSRAALEHPGHDA